MTGSTRETFGLRRSLVAVVGAVAVVVLATVVGAGDALLFAALLAATIILHEFGHFVVAKATGMQVTEFFVGFGPRIWSVRRGETEYGVKALPLGGYVRITGMTVVDQIEPALEPRSYRSKSSAARIGVSVAGSAMHMLIAFVLLLVVFASLGAPVANQVQIQGLMGGTTGSGPAAAAGLHVGDIIVAVDGRPVRGDPGILSSAAAGSVGHPIAITIERGGRRLTLDVTPVTAGSLGEHPSDGPGTAGQGVIGVVVGPPLARVPLPDAAGRAATGLGDQISQSVIGVGELFSPSGFASRLRQVGSASAAQQAAQNGTRAVSIVGIVQTGGQAVHAGLYETLTLLILINVFVGVFNLVPMLPLDGGYVAIALYERIRQGRSKIRYHADIRRLAPFSVGLVAIIGMVVLLSVLVDIAHPLSNPFG